MIIMINGAFGAGKTTVANRLQEKIPNAMIFDPEEIGFMLRNIVTNNIQTKEEMTGDFQDMFLWRKLTVDIANGLIQQYHKNLIIPMTICKKEYLEYIRTGLSRIDSDIFHFILTAPIKIIHDRLKKRGDQIGSWPYQQTLRCIEMFENCKIQERIDTSLISPDEITELIIKRCSNHKQS